MVDPINNWTYLSIHILLITIVSFVYYILVMYTLMHNLSRKKTEEGGNQ